MMTTLMVMDPPHEATGDDDNDDDDDVGVSVGGLVAIPCCHHAPDACPHVP